MRVSRPDSLVLVGMGLDLRVEYVCLDYMGLSLSPSLWSDDSTVADSSTFS